MAEMHLRAWPSQPASKASGGCDLECCGTRNLFAQVACAFAFLPLIWSYVLIRPRRRCGKRLMSSTPVFYTQIAAFQTKNRGEAVQDSAVKGRFSFAQLFTD
jgi:hypothetical protein